MRETKTKSAVKKLASFVKHPFIKKNKPLLHTVEWVLVLLAFFAVGFAVIFYQTSLNFVKRLPEDFFGEKRAPIQTIEEQKEFVGETVQEPIDTTAWDTYRNKYYGFEIQHPDEWTNMQYKTPTEKSARYETIYKFRKNSEGEGDDYIGFDVAIYPAKKVGGLENTNDIHKKENMPEDKGVCAFSEEVTLGGQNAKFQKVSIGPDNPCYEPAYFFSLEKSGYIYNIVPTIREDAEKFSEPEKRTTELFPEYAEVVSSFKTIPIARPVLQSPKPRITAKRPVAAKVVGGKLVCAKKNDKPRKSKKNKPGHLDLECCLDPDERPNPWCTY